MSVIFSRNIKPSSAKHCQVPYKRLLLGIRGELGEENGRFHFHCVVGGTNMRNYESLAHYAEWLWKRSINSVRCENPILIITIILPPRTDSGFLA
jgi:hypothetical protein